MRAVKAVLGALGLGQQPSMTSRPSSVQVHPSPAPQSCPCFFCKLPHKLQVYLFQHITLSFRMLYVIRHISHCWTPRVAASVTSIYSGKGLRPTLPQLEAILKRIPNLHSLWLHERGELNERGIAMQLAKYIPALQCVYITTNDLNPDALGGYMYEARLRTLIKTTFEPAIFTAIRKPEPIGPKLTAHLCSPFTVQININDLRGRQWASSKEFESPLVHAATHGHDEAVHHLIQAGALCLQDAAQAMRRAAEKGHANVIRVLAQHKIPVSNPILLTSAVNHRSVDAVRTLLELKAPLAEPLKQEDPLLLHTAVDLRSYDIALLLLKHKANPNHPRSDGASPLFVAACRGHDAIVDTLLEFNADPNQQTHSGATPLWMAANEGHSRVVQSLLHKGAKIELAYRDGTTAIYPAAVNGHHEIVHLLLQRGAVATPDALHAAAANGHLSCVKLLVDQGAKVCGHAGRENTTPLFIASKNGRHEVVQYLLSKNASPHSPRRVDSASPLWIASLLGHTEVVRVLLDAGANPDSRATHVGMTALKVAILFGHRAVAKLLFDAGAKIEPQRPLTTE